jgi:hypothetical protein
MVRMRCFLVLVGLLSLGATHASTCTTVTSGPFTDVNVWDCGCDPIACDTLIIAHAVTIDVDITLNPTQLVRAVAERVGGQQRPPFLVFQHHSLPVRCTLEEHRPHQLW